MSTKHFISLAIAKALKRVPPLWTFAREFNQRRHDLIMRELEPYCQRAMSVCGSITPSENPDDSMEDTIWVFWWQGEASAPPIVRACIGSIRANAGDREVVVITKDNVKRYASFPNTIYEKVQDGSVTLTHFSDLLRFNLLSRHGGLWMDATLFLCAPLELGDLTEGVFTCSGYSDPTLFNVSDGRWTGFFIGGPSHNDLFRFMDYFFAAYWADSNQMLDYFLIDYGLCYAWSSNIGGFREAALSSAGLQPHLFDLQPLVSEQFDETKWEKLAMNTSVFKLSYKKAVSIERGSFADALLFPFLAGSTRSTR